MDWHSGQIPCQRKILASHAINFLWYRRLPSWQASASFAPKLSIPWMAIQILKIFQKARTSARHRRVMSRLRPGYRGGSSMVESETSNLRTGVRFPFAAPRYHEWRRERKTANPNCQGSYQPEPLPPSYPGHWIVADPVQACHRRHQGSPTRVSMLCLKHRTVPSLMMSGRRSTDRTWVF